MKKNQIIVVEGYHDQIKIQSIFPNISVITTNGSEISDKTLNLIFQASKDNEVILFLDPDYPGKQIMKKILDTGGNYAIAYINKSDAMSKNKKKVGVEHASKKNILKALDNKITINNYIDNIRRKDLVIRGLANVENSAKKRKILCEQLQIPFANSKTLLKYLNLLNISLERIDEILYESQ
ncbi:MAG TPA: ribonuclease M5 [Candidatus Izemoplasmatales bacterium]|nr:ribonuclease M5 [Candidatus Izemoplasmatales bacterium]